jgi:CRP/FNR family cyclic AMP-dependent transcriptional regulator
VTRAEPVGIVPAMTGALPRWLGWIRDPGHGQRVAILERTPVFAGLPRRLLGRLAVRLFEKAYAPGEVVFRQGDPGKGLFIVVDGSVDVVRETPAGELRLASFGPGTSFGELALIDDLPRSATVRVTEPARLLILYRTHFEALVEGDRAVALVVMRNLLRTLASYIRGANGPSQPGSPPTTPSSGPGLSRSPAPS